MLDQFYVGRDIERFGPFSAARLKDLADSGRLRATDTIWREGMASPILAGQVKKLFPPAQPKTHVDFVSAPEVAVTPAYAAPETTAQSAAVATVEKEAPHVHQPEPARKRRAVALKGVIILSQDGQYVYYRKKCVQCSHEDTSRSSMLIFPGVIRSNFFCTKCRKSRVVELQGMIQ